MATVPGLCPPSLSYFFQITVNHLSFKGHSSAILKYEGVA